MPPSPPPSFEYHYWKCYFPHGSREFKAAVLFSVDVDYYTYGMCRLILGAYYCGALSTAAPYKGQPNTVHEKVHIGSDEYFEPGDSKPKAPTGSYAIGAAYDKVRKPLNADYYKQMDAHHWQQAAGNNGQYKEHPTTDKGLTKAVYSNGNIGQNLTSRFRFGVKDKNEDAFNDYALRPGAAALYNDGLHIVNGTSSNITNPTGRTYFSVVPDTDQKY